MPRNKKPRTNATQDEKLWWEKLRELCKSKPQGLQIFAYGGYFYALDSENHVVGNNCNSQHFVPLDLETISVDCDGGDPNWA